MTNDNDCLGRVWTLDSLKVHLESLISASERAAAERFAAQNIALNRADSANEKRLDSVNEFRAQLRDQATSFLPRDEYSARHEQLSQRILTIETRVLQMTAQSDGRHSVTAPIAALIATVATGVLVFALTSAIGGKATAESARIEQLENSVQVLTRAIEAHIGRAIK